MPDQHSFPRVKCASCQASLVIDPSMLLGPICCSECGEALPVDAYPNLSKIRAAMIADKAAAEEARGAAQQLEASRIRAQREKEREARRIAAIEEAQAKAARKEMELNLKLQRERDKEQQRNRMQAKRLRERLVGMSAMGSVGAFCADVLLALGAIALAVAVLLAIFSVATSRASDAGFAILVPAMSLLGIGAWLFLAGAFWHSLLYAAEAIIAKLQLILDRLDRPFAITPGETDSAKQSMQDGHGPDVGGLLPDADQVALSNPENTETGETR